MGYPLMTKHLLWNDIHTFMYYGTIIDSKFIMDSCIKLLTWLYIHINRLQKTGDCIIMIVSYRIWEGNAWKA